MVLAKSLDLKNTGWKTCTWSHLNKASCFLLLLLGGTFEFLWWTCEQHTCIRINPCPDAGCAIGVSAFPLCAAPGTLCLHIAELWSEKQTSWRYALSTAPFSLYYSAVLQQFCWSGRVGYCKVSSVMKHIPTESPALGRTFEIPRLKPQSAFLKVLLLKG